MMKRSFLLVVLFAVHFVLSASSYKVESVWPTHWWVGMKNPNLQLMVRGMNAQTVKFSVSYPGVKLVKVTISENNNYAFLDLVISPSAKPGKMKIKFSIPEGNGEITY